MKTVLEKKEKPLCLGDDAFPTYVKEFLSILPFIMKYL